MNIKIYSSSKNDVKSIFKKRMLEYKGYKNKQLRILYLKKQIVGNVFSIMPVVVMTLFVVVAFFVGLTYTSYKGQLTADMSGIQKSSFANNWAKLALDKEFHAAIKNSLIFTGIVTSITLVWALVLASILNLSNIKGRKLFLVAFFVPQVTSQIATTIVFSAMLKHSLNTANSPSNWFWIMAIIGLWTTSPSSIIIFNTAFTNIGNSEYEAASMDGARTWTKFWKITIPALAPIIAYQLIMTIIIGMTSFGSSYMMIISNYVTGVNIRSVILWPVIGLLRIRGNYPGVSANVGLGMIELLLLGFTLIVFTVIANFIQPIQGRK